VDRGKDAMKKYLRLSAAIICGNVVGYAAFRAAAWLTPQLWIAAGEEITFGMRLTLIAVSAISFATPPVIIGALAAKVASRHELFAGLAASAWGVTAIQWWPAIPTLPSESWLAPMTLIFLSGLMGAWVMIGFNARAS
jgi:hypothetical protein